MLNKIFIFGASGSGTTTLGKALASKLNCQHFDSDNYYWISTNPPFTKKRELTERQELLRKDLLGNHRWVLSGSLCGWGDIFIPLFDLAVYLWIPQDIRIKRLVEREEGRYGKEAIQQNGKLYEQSKTFIEWASKYDSGDLNIRSRALHEEWMKGLKCCVLRIEGDFTAEDRVKIMMRRIEEADDK